MESNLNSTEIYYCSSKFNSTPPGVQPGRFNSLSFFSNYANENPGTTAAVLVCGPHSMVADVLAACRSVSKKTQVNFDISIETFEL